MASTYDLIKVLNGHHRPMQNNRMTVLEVILDCAEHNIGSAETADILTIPAGFVRLDQHGLLLTAEGGTGTVDIGVAGALDGLIDGGNVNGTANAFLAKGTNGAAGPVLYTADTTVTLTANNALDAAKIWLMITGYMTDFRG
jgi:hypothetical protein